MYSQSDDPHPYQPDKAYPPITDKELDQWEQWNMNPAPGFVPNQRIGRLIAEVRRLRHQYHAKATSSATGGNTE